MKRLFSLTRALVARKRKIFALFFALAASIGMMNAKVTWNSSNISDLKVRSYQSYSKEGVTLSANSDMVEARWQDFGDESMDGISFNANETGGYTFSNTLGKNFTKIQMTLNSPSSWNYANLGSGWSFSWEPIENKPATVTWTGNASTVDLLKEASDFGGEQVRSIVFYFVGDSEAPDPTYTVALKDGTANADKVTLSATSAVEGATVTVTLNEEYEFKAFKATYNTTEELSTSFNTETEAYSFKMPAYDVTIEATITLKPVPEGDVFAGFTATAGSGGFNNEGHANLVDNKFTSTDWTKWCADNSYKSVPTGESGDACWWIDFEASAALNLTGYILTTGNDSGNEHGRNPKNWLLKAKLNAGDAWTTIATVTDDVNMKNQSFKDYKFFVDQSGSYKYFRFEVFANQGADVLQLCQLRLIGTEAAAPTANLKLIEFQVPASWENDNSPITSADFPGFVATTYEIASALPINSDEPALVIFDFPGDDEVTVYTKMGGQVKEPSTGTIVRSAFSENAQAHYYYPVLAGGGSTATVVTITEADFPTGGESITKDGVTVSAGWIEGNSYDIYGEGSFSTTLGNFTKIEVCAAGVSIAGEGWSGNSECKTWTGNASSVSFSGDIMGNSQGVTLKFTIGDAAATPAYETVMNLINAIGEVAYTAECKAKIDEARAAYNALSDGDKEQVNNIITLTTAETAYKNLVLDAAQPAIAAIKAIPSPITSNLKLSAYEKVTAAREAYDALTDEEKAAIPEYLAFLEEAEAAFAAYAGGGSAPDGALNGKFTIDESSVVYFSKGNLQATTTDLGANWTWGFAANQYDTIGNVAANNAISGNGTVSANGTVDLFGWSTSATKYGIHNGTNRNISDYAGDFADWGATMGDGWFTLSKEQWEYLLNTRTGDKAATVNSVADCRYAKATINTDGTAVKGMILFPDGGTFAASEFTEVGSPNTEDANYTTTCTTAQWNALQAKGCVFLPAAGNRYSESVSNVGSNGYYWSSSPKPSTDDAYYMFFYSGGMFASNDFRCMGLSVRLVTEAPASPLADAQAAKDLIDAIGEVSYPDSKEAIKAAREAVDALGANASLLDEADLNKLTQAEAAYAQLLAQAVKAVKDQIDALPATPLTDATKKLSEYNKVTDAREAYDALSDEEKAAVDNYDKLTAAEEAFAAIGGGTGLKVSTEDIGKVLCTDGSLYATKDEATAASKTPVAMIAYVEDSKGLAIALEDESERNIWSTAITTAAAHTPAVTGGTWKLPSLLEWQQMFVGCGADLTPSETSGNVTDYTGLRDKLLAAGGKGFVEWSYWTTTEWADKPEEVWNPYFSFSPEIVKWYKNKKDRDDFYVRAILAFNVVASKALADAQAAKDLIDAIPQQVVLSDECKAKIDAAREAVTALGENASLLDDADIDKLAKAEADFALLIKDATAVADKIAAIGEVTFSADSKGKIADARNAYEALSDELKPYVSNLAVLTAAEAAYEAARPSAPVTTVPAAVEALQYTGAVQTLITAGVAEHGTILYSLDGENYSTELPTALLPGAYTVYYKVQATDDYKDVAPVTVIATIAYHYPATYSLFGIPEGWSVKVNDEEVAVVNGAVKNIAANDRFDIMPVKPEDVKKVEVVPYLLDLATVTDSVIYILDGDSITGTANGPITVVIVPDAKVYFKDVNLTNTGSHPAVLCGGNAEIVVVGENTITCTKEDEYGIRAAGAGTTLTVSGDKTLLKATIDPNGGTVNQ